MNRKKLILLLIISFAIRFLCILIFANTSNPEMWEFGKIARNLLAGHGYQYIALFNDVPSAYMPPGLPFLYYLFFKLFGDAHNTYIIILSFNSLLATLNVIILYEIAEIIYGPKVAFFSAIYAMISPILIFSTINYNSIIIYQLLIGISFLYFLKSSGFKEIKELNMNKNAKNILLLSFILGLFIYFRSEIVGFIIILFIYFIVKKRMTDAIVILVVPIIIISPWAIRNYLTFGKFVPVSTSVGYNFFTGHGDENAAYEFNKRISMLKEDSTFETEKSKIGFQEGFKYINEHPAEDIKQSFFKIISLWTIDEYRDNAKNPVYIFTWLLTLILFVIGYIKSVKNKNYLQKLFFMNTYLIFSSVLVIIFFNIPRYQIQMSFIMIPTAMYGLLSFSSRFIERKAANKF